MSLLLIRWHGIAVLALLAVLAYSAVTAAESTGTQQISPELAPDSAQPTQPPSSPDKAKTPDYVDDVEPIFNSRCIACHGCLGSPCNVKLDSFRGVERGGFGLNAYSDHIGNYPRTDMDAAHSVKAWRNKGFYPIVADEGSAAENLDQSLLYLMVEAGMSHNDPGFARDALEGLRPDRFNATCPSTAAALKAELKKHPAIGMPFGLPALTEAQFETLKDWVAAGSPGPTDAQKKAAEQIAEPNAVARWETFFNQDDERAQLVSRYIFEHVFLATIVLEESPGDQFRLVRSKTPPGQSVEIIGTGLPYDDPYSYANVDRFWYRLEKLTAPPVQKNHFLWTLSLDQIDHLTKLFALDTGKGWGKGAELSPGWGSDNALKVFAAIPAESRYRFMLENSEVIVGGITYGPVCNGQTATYAVKDQFWVFFLDPEYDPSVQAPMLGLDSWDTMMNRSVFGNADYLKAFASTKEKLFPKGWSLDAVWDGNGDDRNAWLTVLRHETNVSVVKGAQGGVPRSLWLISFAGFERMYYDTVAGFAYWEGDGLKLETLLFFNFLRQAFEDNFLTLLPPEDRQALRHEWTQGIGSIGLAAVPFAAKDQPTQVEVSGDDPLIDLIEQLEHRLGPTISGLPDRLNPQQKPKVELDATMSSFDDWAISTLTAVEGLSFVPQLPSVIMLRLNQGDEHRVYSLIANRAYKSQYTLVFENGEAMPKKDSMSVYPTLVNGFPNLFVDLDLEDAPGFLVDLSAVETSDDWTAFKKRYGILRNSSEFWSFYDWINAWNFDQRGDLAGWLDLTYYDAPET
ncbi:fatty acid cis/trans isomerase [Halochromatium sp.]